MKFEPPIGVSSIFHPCVNVIAPVLHAESSSVISLASTPGLKPDVIVAPWIKDVSLGKPPCGLTISIRNSWWPRGNWKFVKLIGWPAGMDDPSGSTVVPLMV